MNEVRKKMIKIYNMKNMCWMGYKVSKNNPYTFHHIKKASEGGKLEIENGAILTKNAHDYLHLIETRDLELYIYINTILRNINDQGFFSTKHQLLTIESLLRKFEQKHKFDKNCEGKILIKKEYYKRIYSPKNTSNNLQSPL